MPHASQIKSLSLALCLTIAPISVAAEDLLFADNPKKILEVARGFGSAELETDTQGDPVIRGRMEGNKYSVYFYGCEDGKDCTTIQFWTYTSAPPDALAAVNAWNRDRRFGNAYIDDEGDVAIEMDVNLWGGVTAKNLDDTFDWWRSILKRVDEELDGSDTTPKVPSTESVEKSL